MGTDLDGNNDGNVWSKFVLIILPFFHLDSPVIKINEECVSFVCFMSAVTHPEPV